MMRIPLPCLAALVCACVAGVATADPSSREANHPEAVSLGFLLELSDAGQLPAVTGPCRPSQLARLEARWVDVELVPGAYDWTATAPAIDALVGAGYRPVLALTGSHPDYLPAGGRPSPLVGRSMEAWLKFVRSAARTFAGRVTTFELDSGPPAESEDEANLQALLLKQSALAVRAEAGARGVEVRLVQGAVDVEAVRRQRALWERDLAAYFDVLPVHVDATRNRAAIEAGIRAMFGESVRHPPAQTIWAYVRGGDGWDAAGRAAAALASGASAALFPPVGTEQVAWASGLHRTLADGYAPASPGRLRLDYGSAGEPASALVLGRFFNEQDYTTLVVLHAPEGGDDPGAARLVVDASTIRNVRILDPITGSTKRARNTAVDDGPGRAVSVSTSDVPQAVLFERQVATPGFELPAEQLDVESERGLTAEEIIARYQLLQRDQDDRLERWTATGRIDFHFKLAQSSSTVDVSIDSHYFWERGGDLEWEQTQYYINGNKVRWKNIPELPLIQPEKVITLPLDLTLDRTYDYRLVGQERVGGSEAYVVAFEPSAPDPTLSLYRGRVWIDKRSFARVKASVVQNNLEAPVLSNEEIDRFELRVGPDGRPYWMFSRIDGQQVWNAAGRTFVVERELTFSDIEINPPRGEFEASRDRAYASENQMLRDTEQGFRYLERKDDGTRAVKMTEDTSQLFAAGGAFKDNSQDSVVPLAGVNYFNYDLWGKDIQFNVLFAGVLGFVTASKPTLGGTRMDFTVDAGLNALKFDDEVYEGDTEVEAEQIEGRSQTLALRLGVPAGQFVKFNFIGGLAYRQQFASSDGQQAIDSYNLLLPPAEQLEFVLPEDHLQITGTAEMEFNRKGYNLTGAFSRASRSDWEPWGLRDGAGNFGRIVAGAFVSTGGEPVEDDFTRWRFAATKEWHLPKFQKIRGGVDYLNGSDLDRFSRYQFNFFGDDRLNGYSGSGVRFDEGVIGRVGYAFNLFEVIRFDAALESARVEQEGSGEGTQAFSGIGLSANLVGPWKTVINLNYGYALASDIPDLEGEQEFLLLVFKLF